MYVHKHNKHVHILYIYLYVNTIHAHNILYSKFTTEFFVFPQENGENALAHAVYII